jgi:hypothetical protein
MDKIFVNIIILPVLCYFQLFKGYFHYSKLFHLHYLWPFMGFLVIFSYLPYVTFGYSKLLLVILGYFILGYFRLL